MPSHRCHSPTWNVSGVGKYGGYHADVTSAPTKLWQRQEDNGKTFASAIHVQSNFAWTVVARKRKALHPVVEGSSSRSRHQNNVTKRAIPAHQRDSRVPTKSSMWSLLRRCAHVCGWPRRFTGQFANGARPLRCCHTLFFP